MKRFLADFQTISRAVTGELGQKFSLDLKEHPLLSNHKHFREKRKSEPIGEKVFGNMHASEVFMGEKGNPRELVSKIETSFGKRVLNPDEIIPDGKPVFLFHVVNEDGVKGLFVCGQIKGTKPISAITAVLMELQRKRRPPVRRALGIEALPVFFHVFRKRDEEALAQLLKKFARKPSDT